MLPVLTRENSNTGLIDCSGDGQIDFVVNLQPGYELVSVIAEPATAYKNFKDPVKTGITNGYRFTKVKGNLAITVIGKCPHNTNVVHMDSQEATCTERGWEACQTCKNCDYTTYKELAALGHDYQEVEGSANPATCTEAGKKGAYYKFILVAIDRDNKVVSTSKVIHIAAKGGKVGNHKGVKVNKTVIAKAKKLRIGKTLKLRAKAVKATELKVKKHRSISYESSDPNIAGVSKKGLVKAKNRGICYIYAYAQSGVYKKIKVVVK